MPLILQAYKTVTWNVSPGQEERDTRMRETDAEREWMPEIISQAGFVIAEMMNDGILVMPASVITNPSAVQTL